MQAPAVVETASGKSYHKNGGNIQKDEPSNPKKENLSLSSNGYNEAKSTFLDDDWNYLPLGQIANDKAISNIDKTDTLEPTFTASPDTSIGSSRSQSSECEDSIEYAFFNETYSIHYSESKLKNESLIYLNSELNSEMQKREEVFFETLECQGSKIIGLERNYRSSDNDDKETAEDVQKHDIDEDSQREYHSAEEQEYISYHLSFDQMKTLSIPNLEMVELRNSGYEVKYDSNTEDNHVKLESSSSISVESTDVNGQKNSPHISKFPNSVTLRQYCGLKHDRCEEQETSSVYHTLFDEVVLRSSPLENRESQSKSGFLNPQSALKTKIYAGRMKSHITERKNFCGDPIIENKILQDTENPSTLPQDKALESLLQPCKDCQTSFVSDDSVISACGCSHYESLQNTPDPAIDVSVPLPKIPGKDNQAIEGNSSLRVPGSTANKTCFHHMKRTCPESGADTAGHAVTVKPVGVSADFRACSTTSRAASARPARSASSSTETVMDKGPPGKWQSKKPRSVACNTDGTSSQDDGDAQAATTKGLLGKSLSDSSLKPDGNFRNKDSLELKTFDITDLKKHPERESRLSKEMEKNLPSECCQKIMQRAIKAELHLLNVHYQMCHRYCSDIYRLVMGHREGVNRNLSNSSTKKELGASLLSVLGDLKVRYEKLKEKINKGVPLEELPPLSLESKLLSTFSTFAARLMKEESHIFAGADSELDNQSTHDVDISSSRKKTLSQTSLLSDNSHPKEDKSPKEDGLKNGDIDIDFSQLKLDDKEMKNVEPLRREKGYLIHVGGLCPSVSEADLRSHFQKYHVSEISIYDDSSTYRYASLAFKKNSDSKMAVKEMNGVEINGKSVNVRLVKIPGEYISPPSSKNGNRVTLNNLEKGTSKEINSASCVSRFPRTRPRQPGAEQDSEFFPFSQSVKKTCKQIESPKLLPETPVRFIPTNTLNLRSFTKIMKRLAELHPEVSRDRVIDALQKVRGSHKGFLNGLPINTIVEMTSSVLKDSASS
ncbi:RNA-binding protein 44 isoform X2 [Manis javanica]|uniref:RNA-binding protein 44 isoform X2 n=1 Tax=Manis javanica TaxID=9974 RepID=UPI003C6CE780